MVVVVVVLNTQSSGNAIFRHGFRRREGVGGLESQILSHDFLNESHWGVFESKK